MTNTKKKAIKKLSEKFNLTYDEAINILSSQQSFLNYMETIDINGFPNFFKYLMNEDNIDIIEILLNIGLDVNNTVDTAGRSALHYVASAGANNLLNILIRYWADVNIQCNIYSTPLIRAVGNDNYDGIKILLENGANINLADDAGTTPLHYATTNSSFEMVRYLIRSGADINLVDNNGFTVLDIAQFLVRTDIENYIKTLGEA